MSPDDQAVPTEVTQPDAGASPTPPAPADEPTQPEPQTETQELPPEVKEKTRQRFEDLTSKLKDATERLERKSVFEEFPQAPTQPTPAVPGVNMKDYISEDGTVDVQGMNQAVNTALQAGHMGQRQAQVMYDYIQKMDQRFQEAEAYQEHKDLNPKADEFDSEFRDLVSDRLLRNYLQAQANPKVQVMSLKEAADSVRKLYARTPQKQVTEAVEKYKESQENRQQGPIARGRGNKDETTDLENLKKMSRSTNKEQQQAALMARLKKAGL